MASEAQDYGPLLQRALERIEALEAELAGRGPEQRDPVAVVGIGCRFPGADGPDAYWRLLAAGGDAIGEVPPDRWDAEALTADPRTAATRYGGFVGGLADFDAALFGISPREAVSLDPQQRLLLEVAWEAFEHAGIPPRDAPARTGVYVGISNIDYRESMAARGIEEIDGYFSSGGTASTASGRLSYVFGLSGPSISLDTACSSSAVAVHLAVQDLRRGVCDVALAGGVNRIVTPHESVSLARARMLASDGRCKTFDAAADGYVRAEGGGLLVLRRLSDAEARGDRVLALIHGSAVNQDGRRSGLTVPHGPSQQAVIREALRDAAAEPEDVGYVEAHGTGTALGDPIEAGALGAVFAGRSARLPVGSVKTNVGHLESAAGVAGLVKAVLALRHGALPPTLHLREPNPYIDWDALPIRVPTTLEQWGDGPRFAGVSSFGFSGTNCHVVLGPAPAAAPPAPAEGPAVLALPLAARTEAALAAAARRWEGALREGSAADLCFTAATGRAELEHRLCAVGVDGPDLADRLSRARVARGRAPASGEPPRVAFVFTGQGAQHAGMGAELYRTEPVFAAALDRCAAVADTLLDRPLLAVMESGEGLDETGFTQPALVAFELALAELWRSVGIVPSAVLGHSVGEYAAACVAGVLSVEDCIRLVVARGRLMQALPAGGAMVAVRADPDRVAAALEGRPLVSIAAINAPGDVVVSGDRAQVDALVDELGAEARRLTVSHAFHSPLVDPMLEDFAAVVRRTSFAAPTLPLISNVTGAVAEAGLVCDPSYWVRHAREVVRFADGVRALGETGADAVVEVGPKPVLIALARTTLPRPDVAWLPSVRPGREREELLGAAGELWVRGAPLDWAAVTRRQGRRADAPTYPFERERYWIGGRPPAWQRWLLAPGWCSAGDPGPGGSPGRWHVLGAGADTAIAALRAGGSDSVPVSSVEAALDEPGVAGVVFAPEPSADGAAGDAALTHVGALLEIVQALARRASPPRLWVLTRHGQDVAGGEPVDPAHAALWGLARTIAAERPELRCATLDLDGDPGGRLAAILDAPPSTRLALRDGRLLAQDLRRMPPQTGGQPTPLHRDGTYLITGGTGAIGLAVARRLAEDGAGRIVLSSRGGTAPEEALLAIRRAGASVRTVRNDIADEEDVERLVAECSHSGPLRGVIHAAGVLDDDVLEHYSAERARRVLLPKVLGAWHLHRLTRDAPLEFFVAFSSLAAVVETARGGPYAAANAFLDGLMLARRGHGLPGLSIAWGPWARAGMGAGEEATHAFFGLRAIDPGEGAAAAVALARSSNGHVVAAPADWVAVVTKLPASAKPFLAALAGTDRPAARVPSPAAHALRDDLSHSEDPWPLLASRVESLVMDVLGRRDSIDPAAGFADLGMDSLMAMELRERLQQELAIELPATVAFRHPRLDDLVPFLAAQVGLVASEHALSDDTERSDDDVVSLIAERFREHHGG